MISVKLDVDLVCPECGEHNLFPHGILAAGKLVGCEHCGAELALSHNRESAEEPPVWRLESTLPDENEKRAG